jgi:hypothetical protein
VPASYRISSSVPSVTIPLSSLLCYVISNRWRSVTFLPTLTFFSTLKPFSYFTGLSLRGPPVNPRSFHVGTVAQQQQYQLANVQHFWNACTSLSSAPFWVEGLLVTLGKYWHVSTQKDLNFTSHFSLRLLCLCFYDVSIYWFSVKYYVYGTVLLFLLTTVTALVQFINTVFIKIITNICAH